MLPETVWGGVFRGARGVPVCVRRVGVVLRFLGTHPPGSRSAGRGVEVGFRRRRRWGASINACEHVKTDLKGRSPSVKKLRV